MKRSGWSVLNLLFIRNQLNCDDQQEMRQNNTKSNTSIGLLFIKNDLLLTKFRIIKLTVISRTAKIISYLLSMSESLTF